MKKTLIFLFSLFCTITGVKADEFTFALFTDTHIARSDVPTEDLQRAVEDVNKNSQIEFVLVSGDITEEGDYKSLALAKSLLEKLQVPYYVIPGNHETKWTESGMTDFGKVFGGERFNFTHKGFLFLGFNTGPLMRMADGHVVPQDITWLKEELAKAGKETPVFLVTHYPLKEGDVDNWYEVTDAVRPYNIRTFLGGHYHSNREFRYDGIPGILSRSTLRAKDPKGGYSEISVTKDSILIAEKIIGESPKQWATLSLHKTYFEEKGDPNKYPDFSMNDTYSNVKRTWLHHTGVGIYSSPATDGKQLYVGDDLGYLTAYQVKNGKEVWKFQAKHRIVGTPDVSEGVVVFGAADNFIYGLNAKNGKQLWKVETKEPVLGAVTIDNGKAYVGSSDGTFRAIDIKTGEIAWIYDKVKGYIESKPLITENKVIFGAWDNTLYALDKNKGNEIWLWDGDIKGMHFSPAAVWPVAAHNKVFITDPKRAMTAIDLKNGETVWRTSQAMVRETIGISEDKKRIYSKTMNDSIVCFSAESDYPNQLWASDVGFGYEHAPSMQVEKEGVMYGSTKNGLLFALNPYNGEVLWKHKVGNSLISTVVPLKNKKLLFTATGGEVGLLEWK